MDTVGRTAKLICVVLAMCCAGLAQSSGELERRVQELMDRQQWAEVVSVGSVATARSADVQLNVAIAFARLGRVEESRRELLRGREQFPRDARFPTELGGIELQKKNNVDALRWARVAHRLAPRDEYVNDMLGTVYFLLENEEAALKYWNRVGKPRIENSRTSSIKTDAVLVDRAIAYAPGEVMTLDELLTTRARLRNLAVFPRQTLELTAREDGKFDATLRLSERNGWGANKWEGLLTTFGGVLGQTIRPQYYNIGGSATNLVSAYRWDPEKRRIRGTVSGPLRRSPRWRYTAEGEFRNENWDVRNFSGSVERLLGSLNLRRSAGSLGIRSVENGKWSWSTGAEVSYRDFRSVSEAGFPSSVLMEGTQLKHLAQVDYEALRYPQRRFVLTTNVATQAAKIWADAGHSFFKFQGSATAEWFPQAQGDDWQMLHRVSAGSIWGDVPFDELFALGLERDTDLTMRGHVGTHHGRRGNAPMGTRYFLSNWEFDKNVFEKKFVLAKLGPFVDTGKVTGPALFGSDKWLWDAGVQLKVKVMGAQVVLSYGRDLRGGGDAIYARLGGWSGSN